MSPKEAARILLIDTGLPLSEARIRHAFLDAVREAHPDTAIEPSVSKLTIDEIKKARDVMLREARRAADIEDCHRCGGAGEFPSTRLATLKCAVCNGEGVVRRKSK